MSNVIHLHPAAKSLQAMREEAALWIVMISEGASEEDLQKVHEWLEEHPDHVQALMDVARMWDEVSVLSELSDIFPLQEYVNPQPVKARRGMVYAALAVCLVLLSFTLVWLPGTGSESGPDTAQLSYETRVGQQSTVVLPDGSVVVLNTNTHIEMSFSSTYRDIILHRGEGHFTVEKDSSRPFRVHANGGIVEAVGTAFTVQQLGHEGLEVSVLEGEVNFTRIMAPEPAVAAPPVTSLEQAQSQPRAQPVPVNTATTVTKAVTSPIPLVAGEMVEVNSKDDDNVMKQTIGVAELQSRLAWRDGMLLFQGDTLETVIREVSRYTSIRIDVDEKVRDIPVLGNFRTGDVEGILLSMSTTFNLQVERLEEGHIVLKAAN